MWHAVIWTLTAVFAAGWSLLCWAMHQLLTGPQWLALGDDAWLDWLSHWRLPAWLADWLPLGGVGQLQVWLLGLGPWIESLLVHVPGVLSWLTPVLWLAWAIGMLLLLLVGLAGSVLVAAVRRSTAPQAPGP